MVSSGNTVSKQVVQARQTRRRRAAQRVFGWDWYSQARKRVQQQAVTLSVTRRTDKDGRGVTLSDWLAQHRRM